MEFVCMIVKFNKNFVTIIKEQHCFQTVMCTFTTTLKNEIFKEKLEDVRMLMYQCCSNINYLRVALVSEAAIK